MLAADSLYIVGVPKAGTTSIFHYLSMHPCLCASIPKETNFFIPLVYDNNTKPLTEYHSHFSHYSKEKYIMEASPGNFYGGKRIAERIREVSPKTVKVIIVFREPVDRLFSYYRHKLSGMHLEKHMTFEQYIMKCMEMPADELFKPQNYVYMGLEGGKFSKYLEEWVSVFSLEDLKILFFDDLMNDRASFVSEILKWLSLSPYSSNLVLTENKNVTVNYRNYLFHVAMKFTEKYTAGCFHNHPVYKGTLKKLYLKLNSRSTVTMPSRIKHCLEKYYEPHNIELKNLLLKCNIANLPPWLVSL